MSEPLSTACANLTMEIGKLRAWVRVLEAEDERLRQALATSCEEQRGELHECGRAAAAERRILELEGVIAGHYENVYLIGIIARIREVTGVGARPMLSELPEAIGTRIREMEEEAAKAAEIHARHILGNPAKDAADMVGTNYSLDSKS